MRRKGVSSATWAKIGGVAAFGVTMAFFEAAIVVYLRAIAYPGGFSFPLVMLDTKLAVVEVAREFASLVMIGAVAFLAGRRGSERFAWYMFIFGVWDIFYYVFLKLVLGWPASLLETDILFLIPVPWVGPVLAPVLVSIALISAGLSIVVLQDRGTPVRLTWRNLGLEIVCGLLVIVSFCLDWRNVLTGGLPAPFAWWLFATGLGAGALTFAAEVRRALRR